MESSVNFISGQEQFMETVFSLLDGTGESEISIAGIWDKENYKQIISRIISSNYSGRCRIIVPHILNEIGISNLNIADIGKSGGRVKVNGRFNKNIILIGSNALIVSFSHKYSSGKGLKTYFGCCMHTDCSDAVAKIKELFDFEWDRSFPLIVDDIQEEIV